MLLSCSFSNIPVFMLISCVIWPTQVHMQKKVSNGPNYGYVALLYNQQKPNKTCVGAIITNWWILDNCPDESGYPYEIIKVGWANSNGDEYGIAKVVPHDDYVRANLTIQGYDTRNMYAAVNALFLHKTDKKIVMRKDVVRVIRVHRGLCLPRTVFAVYLYRRTIMMSKKVSIGPKIICDNHFESHFSGVRPLHLEDSQYCVPVSERFEPPECCYSQSLMVLNNQLVGVMAWSTGCSEELGVDPWVITNPGFFIGWLSRNTNWDQYSSRRAQKSLC